MFGDGLWHWKNPHDPIRAPWFLIREPMQFHATPVQEQETCRPNHPPNIIINGWYVHHQKWLVDDIATYPQAMQENDGFQLNADQDSRL